MKRKTTFLHYLFSVMIALVVIGCGGGDDPSPKPEPPGSGSGGSGSGGSGSGGSGSGGSGSGGSGSGGSGVDTTKYIGNASKNTLGLQASVRNISGIDTTKFGAAFWAKNDWAIYPYTGNLTNGTLPRHFLNDNVVKDLLKAKPEDWKAYGSSGNRFWRYRVKNQAAFTAKSNSQTHRVWEWQVWETGGRPQGVRGPVVKLALVHRDDPNDPTEVCGWY